MMDVFKLVARYLVPSVRRPFAKELVKMGMSGAETARILDLSRSAITRYIKSEGEAGIELNKLGDVAQIIKEIAAKIITSELDESKIHERIAEITSYILSGKCFRVYHRRINPKIKYLALQHMPNNIHQVFSIKYPMRIRIKSSALK